MRPGHFRFCDLLIAGMLCLAAWAHDAHSAQRSPQSDSQTSPADEALYDRAVRQYQLSPLMQSNPLSDSFKMQGLQGFELKDASEGILVLEQMLKLRDHPRLRMVLYISIGWLIFYWIVRSMILKRVASWPARLGVRVCAFCVSVAMLAVLIPYAVLGPAYLETMVKTGDYAVRMFSKLGKSGKLDP